MSAWTASTARDPRGNASDPLRDVVALRAIGGIDHDVLSCGHRYHATTEPRQRSGDATPAHVRRCPDCILGP